MASQPSQPSQDNSSNNLVQVTSVSVRLAPRAQLIHVTKPNLLSLIACYNVAIDEKAEVFLCPQLFGDHPLPTRYAYYLILHLAPSFHYHIQTQPSKNIQIFPFHASSPNQNKARPQTKSKA